MRFDEIQYEVNGVADNAVDVMKKVTDEQRNNCGIDPRAVREMWYSDDCLAVRGRDRGALDYYGGFEYVDKDFVLVAGDYVFYYGGEDQRVGIVLDMLNGREQIQEEDEEHGTFTVEL